MYTIERKEKTNDNNLFWNWFIASMFFVGVVTTLSLLTCALVYIGGQNMKEDLERLKKRFTIRVNEYTFVPQVYDQGDLYIHLEYLDDNLHLDYAVAKSSHMKVIKRTIFEDICNRLKEKGVLQYGFIMYRLINGYWL